MHIATIWEALLVLRQPEGVFLAGLAYSAEENIEESMQELDRLTVTAGGAVLGKHLFKRIHPTAATFFGPGQVEEIRRQAGPLGADLVIVDHELKPGQQRNLEKILGVRVIDRTQLILDIFARRAKTHEGKIQVELAQLTYLLPRLIGKGGELSRLGGGIGTRGPGETKLEDDRRRLRTRIALLKRQLETVKKTRALHRQDREAVPLSLVSLMGYTNAGKSALLRALTGAAAFVEDKLFATLDLSTRKMVLPPSQEILLTDTVGFIRRLPHHLVAAFRGTLEEIVSADLLLQVVDSSHPDWQGQIKVVSQVLAELGAADKPQIMVFNKTDLISRAMHHRLRHQFPGAVLVSALTREGLEQLVETLKIKLAETWQRIHLRLQYDESDLRALILKRGRVIREKYGAQDLSLVVELPPKTIGQLQRWRQEKGRRQKE
ncbi:GTPase HflX [candidate division FCPU426 bacterium]|nr:GTPase HflX [candidate division FCPU426 bacterium]